MRYEAAIFDLDGTLLNTLRDLADAVNYGLSRAGLPLRREDEVMAFLGNGIRRLVECAVPEGTPLSVTHINLLDGTIEGVECARDRAFGVQYHPESAPGPQDSAYLFDRFLDFIRR